MTRMVLEKLCTKQFALIFLALNSANILVIKITTSIIQGKKSTNINKFGELSGTGRVAYFICMCSGGYFLWGEDT